MIEIMDKIVRALFTVLKAVLTVVLVGMVVILAAHIIFRFVLNNSLTWSEELLKILLVWFGLLSVSVLAARREHVAIVVFKDHMPKKVSNVLSKVTQFITVVICLVIIYIGVQYMLEAGFRPTPALRIPYGYAYAAIPVAFFFITIFEFRNLVADLTGKGNYAAIEKPEEDLTGGKEVRLD